MKKWVCKKCGELISGVDVIVQHLEEIHKDGSFQNIYHEEVTKSYYECENCDIRTAEFQGENLKQLKKIAEFKEVTE